MSENNLQDHIHLTSGGSAKFVKQYVTFISISIAVIIISIFWGFHLRTKKLIEDTLLHEAQAFFNEIVITRQWIIYSDGVYVKQTPGTQPNRYLASIPGLNPRIIDHDGDSYVLKSHAAITEKISEIGQREQLVRFKITSLAPLNKINEPDAFETQSLRQFEKGTHEAFLFEGTESGIYFRYMAPLFITKPCLKCHSTQGYKLGDIRGGISVAIPATQIIRELNQNKLYTILAGMGILSLILAIILYISQLFIKDVAESEHKLFRMATTDYLTGLLNRREGIRRFNQEIALSERNHQPLSAIIIDIDDFKQVNDTYGHLAGDQAIRAIAKDLQDALREYDIICRYGGEEFFILLPQTDIDKAMEIAERLRRHIEDTFIMLPDKGAEVNLSISLGVARHSAGETLDNLIYKVDKALYRAKAEGKNKAKKFDPTWMAE